MTTRLEEIGKFKVPVTGWDRIGVRTERTTSYGGSKVPSKDGLVSAGTPTPLIHLLLGTFSPTVGGS